MWDPAFSRTSVGSAFRRTIYLPASYTTLPPTIVITGAMSLI